MRPLFSIIFTLILSTTSFAEPGDNKAHLERSKSKAKLKPEIVKWVGFIESDGGHTTRHDHDLKFVRKEGGESFDIVNSQELKKVHCNKSKKLLAKIEAVRTPQFLFWGNNLIVKKFEVIKELAMIPHKKYQSTKIKNSSTRGYYHLSRK